MSTDIESVSETPLPTEPHRERLKIVLEHTRNWFATRGERGWLRTETLLREDGQAVEIGSKEIHRGSLRMIYTHMHSTLYDPSQGWWYAGLCIIQAAITAERNNTLGWRTCDPVYTVECFNMDSTVRIRNVIAVLDRAIKYLS